MRYFKHSEHVHVFEFDLNEGSLVAHGEDKLTRVEDINHDWYESRSYWHKIASINCSFFNTDGSRNGCSMDDSQWRVKPYPNNSWVNMVWEWNKLKVTTSIDLNDYLSSRIVKGVLPLMASGVIDKRVKQVAEIAPRTFIGQKEDGTVVMCVTDGRPFGLSFENTFKLAKELGCYTAVMLDGGGSSTMVINGNMVNNNENRKVYDALIFYSKEKLEMSEFKCIYPCKSRRVTSKYGKRSSGDGFHDGIDFGALTQGKAGDEIYATHDGTVARAYTSKTYGNCLIINDKETKYSTLYAHMTHFIVAMGQDVKQGQVIGYMGATGDSTGVHLHFEVRDRHYPSTSYWTSHDGEYYSSQDPEKFMQDIVEEVKEKECVDVALKDNIIATYERIEADLRQLKLLIDTL